MGLTRRRSRRSRSRSRRKTRRMRGGGLGIDSMRIPREAYTINPATKDRGLGGVGE